MQPITQPAKATAGDEPAGSKVKVLLVDDYLPNLLALEVLLQDLGLEHVEARSGEEALHRLLNDDFAAILLDVQMPGMDGYETARHIRTRQRSRHTPILFVTAHETDRQAVEKAYELGAVDFLIKPLVPAILRAKVAVFVDLYEKTREVRRQADELRLRERQGFEQKLAEENARLRQSEAALRQSEELFRTMADFIPQLAWMTRPDGYIFWYNRRWYEYTGTTPEEMEGWGWQSVHDPAELPRVMARFKAAIASGEPWEDTFPLRRHDGQMRWHLSRAVPVRDEHGRIVRWFGTNTDITERRQMEEDLLRAREELEDRVRERTAELVRSNRELEQFASVASHDLQEPLRKIQAFGDRLQAKCGETLNEQGREYLERMRSAAARMSTLINDLLAFSRVTTKAQPFAPVDLGAEARQVVSDLEGRIQQVGGIVEVGPLPTVHADPTQMRQLLQNLIGNGLKFHRPEEQPVVRVEGRLLDGRNGEAPAEPWCEITVRDNGIGFEEKYLDRIFQLFQRLHSRSEYEGTGLGLAICRKIVERHGGTITARSAPGQGATFHVTLPVREPSGERTP